VALIFEIAGDQIDGARDYQEDAFLISHLDDDSGDGRGSALIVMADGMGGHAAGNIASNMVISTFNKHFTGGFGKSGIPELLRAGLDKANNALKESVRETPALDGMGCTIVTAALTDGKLYWISVGDSHLYLIRDGKIFKKNDDHSYGGYLDRMKAMGMDAQPEAGLSRNMLMSAVTGADIEMIDCPDAPFELQAGDRLIISSDGLDTLSRDDVLRIGSESTSPKECVAALLDAVTEAAKPRQDNTTAIVVEVTELVTAPVTAPEPAPQVIEDTQPMAAVDPLAETAEMDAVEAPRGGGGKGILIGVAVLVLLLALAGGAYFLIGGKPAATAPAVTSAPATTPTPAPATTAAPAATPAPATTSAPAARATQPPAAAPQPATNTPAPATGTKANTGTAATATPSAPPATPASREFRDRLAAGGEGPVMVRIPAGKFKMGSGGLSVAAEERPRHEVSVAAFAMSKYEITFAEYERFTKATGRKPPDNLYMEKSDHPVISVSWDDAFAYTRWLSKQTGKRYRLPSEAEWEYAARAGTTTPYWWGFDVGQGNAHCFDCKTGLNPRLPTRIGRFKPNPFGLYDTAGNVSEWVYDCYHPSYTNAPRDGGVWEGGDCSYRMARGGSYSTTSKSIRAAKRSKWRSTKGYDSVGFRVAREP